MLKKFHWFWRKFLDQKYLKLISNQRHSLFCNAQSSSGQETWVSFFLYIFNASVVKTLNILSLTQNFSLFIDWLTITLLKINFSFLHMIVLCCISEKLHFNNINTYFDFRWIPILVYSIQLLFACVHIKQDVLFAKTWKYFRSQSFLQNVIANICVQCFSSDELIVHRDYDGHLLQTICLLCNFHFARDIFHNIVSSFL